MAKEKISISADTISARWNKRMKASVADIQAGVEAVSVNPAERAIAKKEKMLQNVTEAIRDGRWEGGLRKVTLGSWKAATKEKIGTRLAGGVDGAMEKRRAFDTWLVSTVNNILPKVNSMPDMTLEDNINRMSTFVREMAENRYKKA